MILASGPFSSSIQNTPTARTSTQQPGNVGSSSSTSTSSGSPSSREGVGDEAVVGRVDGRREQAPVEADHVRARGRTRTCCGCPAGSRSRRRDSSSIGPPHDLWRRSLRASIRPGWQNRYMAQTLSREGVGPPRRPPRRRRARPPLRRPPPRPRGHVAAGVRRPAPGRPHGPPPRPHRRDDGPQRPDHRHRPAGRRPDLGASRWRCSRANCAEFGIRLYPMGAPGPGHRPRDRARAGPHAAGDDDRVRRQPHVDARRVRRARVRHRHERGRARARDADAPAGAARARWRSPSTATLPAGVTAKDIVLAIINRIGTGGGIGSVIEYRGSAIRALSMEGRMTVCNMSIEAGARAGMVAPDDTTFAYLEGREYAPTGAAWEQALDDWRVARHRRRTPRSTRRSCSTPPRCGRRSRGAPTRRSRSTIDDVVPDPDSFADADARDSRASGRSRYMGLKAGTPIREIPSTPCSSARAPTRGSRTCAPRPPSPRGRTVQRRACARWSCPGSMRGEGRRRGRGARTRCSSPPGSTGARRGARCAWR